MNYSNGSNIAAVIINMFAITTYGISGFGNGIIFHMGWQLCYRLNEANCDGSIATADTYIAVAGIVIFPLQVFLLWNHIYWKLGIMLIVFQQIGLFAGTYIAYTFSSNWLPRVLGALMGYLAFQRYLSTFQSSSNANIVPTSSYVIDSKFDYFVIVLVGITSGMFGGLFVTGGPPLMYFTHYINLDKDVCRGTIALTYLAENIERLVILYVLRPVNVATITGRTLLVIVVLMSVSSTISLLVGNAISDCINQHVFQGVILTMLISGSLLLMTTGLNVYNTLGVSTFVISVFLVSYLCIRLNYSSNNPRGLYKVVELQDTSQSTLTSTSHETITD